MGEGTGRREGTGHQLAIRSSYARANDLQICVRSDEQSLDFLSQREKDEIL